MNQNLSTIWFVAFWGAKYIGRKIQKPHNGSVFSRHDNFTCCVQKYVLVRTRGNTAMAIARDTGSLLVSIFSYWRVCAFASRIQNINTANADTEQDENPTFAIPQMDVCRMRCGSHQWPIITNIEQNVLTGLGYSMVTVRNR